jgi:hypothetical protein
VIFLDDLDTLREEYLVNKLAGTLLVTLVTRPDGESVAPCYSMATYNALKESADETPHPHVIGYLRVTYETFDEYVYRKSTSPSEYVTYWFERARSINGPN